MKCKSWKKLDEFSAATRRLANGEGLKAPHPYCKQCSAERREKLRQARFQKVQAKRVAEERRVPRGPHQRFDNMRKRAEGKAGKRVIDELLEAQGRRCAYCLRDIADSFHVEHKTPIVRGGTNEVSNLLLSCPTCNLRKGSQTYDEFMASKRRPLLRGKR